MSYFALGEKWAKVPASRRYADPALGRPKASTINEAQLESARGLMISGLYKTIPLVYGEERISGYCIVKPVIYSTRLVFAQLWSYGECEGVQAVYFNQKPNPGTGVTITHYTGTDSQTVDPTLAAAIPGFDSAYSGFAYSVFDITTTAAIDGFPIPEVVFRGVKCLDPRTSITAWTRNPALQLNNFMLSTVYGPNKQVNGLSSVADLDDSLFESEPRCESNFNFTQPMMLPEMIDIFCVHAECLRSFDGSSLLVVPDAPVEGVAIYGTGGAITIDGDYVDHVFTADGVFTAPPVDMEIEIYEDGVLAQTLTVYANQAININF